LEERLRFLVGSGAARRQHFSKYWSRISLRRRVPASGFDLGKIQNVIDEPEQVFPAGCDVADVPLLALFSSPQRLSANRSEKSKPAFRGRAAIHAHG